ncbi:MAG: hypothetical protein R3219_05580 [Hydrogenovibrio sp.]|nr:hypothetical protein [Hydrogenovibrio sp.]
MVDANNKDKQTLIEQLKALEKQREERSVTLTDEQAKLLARAIKRLLKEQLH